MNSFKLPETMRGVQLSGHGDFDKLEFRNDIPLPIPLRMMWLSQL